jgi:hypothetical protein
LRPARENVSRFFGGASELPRTKPPQPNVTVNPVPLYIRAIPVAIADPIGIAAKNGTTAVLAVSFRAGYVQGVTS